jgi:hypothetical protein
VSKLRDFEVEYDGRRHSDYRNDYAHERHIRAMAKVILAEMVENLTQQSQSDGGNACYVGNAPVVTSNQVVLSRKCGSCTLCCKVMSITELQKPGGTWYKPCLPPGKGSVLGVSRV